MMIIFGIGFWAVGGLVPPPSPNQTAQQLAAFYADNAFRIRLGLIISMLAAGLTFPGYDSLIQDRCDGLIQDHLLSDRCVVTV
ncbi:hypothetical protein [Mycobacterium kiyosense]